MSEAVGPQHPFGTSDSLLPLWATDNPDRALVLLAHEGRQQAYSWTPSSGRLVVATDRKLGVDTVAIDPSGRWIWWFDDADGSECGQWRRQPFNSTTGRPAETPIRLAPASPRGLLLGRDGIAIVGRSTPAGTQIHAVPFGPISHGSDGPTLIYTHPGWAAAQALSHDDRLIAVEHSENGDAGRPAIRVFQRNGQPVAELDDGPTRGLWALGFAPAPSDHRLLVRHERSPSPRLLLWDVDTRLQRQVEVGIAGEIRTAAWFPDARNLLVTVESGEGTHLGRVDLYSGVTTQIDVAMTPILAAAARPDSDVWVRLGGADPALVSARDGSPLLATPGPENGREATGGNGA
ncbi:MAG: hypothetical protein ACK5KU_00635 [Beutenbergiaceae bacterium]